MTAAKSEIALSERELKSPLPPVCLVEVKKRQGEPTPDEGQKYLMVAPN